MEEQVTLSHEQFQAFLAAAEAVPALQQQIQNLQTTPQTSYVPQREIQYKIHEPEQFSGKRQDLPKFFSKLELVFRSAPLRFGDDSTKITYAASFLTGTAFSWLQPYLDAKPTPALLTNYHTFTEQLKSAFGDPNQQLTAEKQLFVLKQKSSASAYASDFRRLASYTNWNSDSLIFKFTMGLKEDIKDELAKIDPINDLDALINKVIKLDDRLYERRRARGNHHNEPRRGFTTDRNDSSYMDVDSVRTSDNKDGKRKTLTKAEKQHRRDNNLCLYCGEAGHKVDACPKTKESGKASARKP